MASSSAAAASASSTTTLAPPRISRDACARISVAFISAKYRSRACLTASDGESASGRSSSICASNPHASWAEQVPSPALAAAASSLLCGTAAFAASLASMATSSISAESTSSMTSCRSAFSMRTSCNLSTPLMPCASAILTIACVIIGTVSKSSLSALAISPSSSLRSRSSRSACSNASSLKSASPNWSNCGLASVIIVRAFASCAAS
mmetsp:Transcript_43782/g.102370  ORF Transcript_43782/g.102370 Transcript_43782/m.102370 type:complete len:208 (+) Transcript_43782:127-750(+)